MASISSAGIGSGLDVNGLVAQLVAAEGAPTQLRLDRREADYQATMSALGSFKGALSSFQSSLEALSELAAFQGRKASSGDEDVFTVTADTAAVPGTYSVEVEQLALANKLRSQPYTDLDATVGVGTLTFSVGAEAFTIDVEAGDTLAGLRDAINASSDNTTVSATVITDMYVANLVLTSRSNGVANAIRVQVTGDAALQNLSYDPPAGPVNLIEVDAATDARLYIDGLAVEAAGNVITEAIEGVTLTLEKAVPGERFSLEVDYDVAAARSKVQTFVDRYNDLVSTYTTSSNYDAELGFGGPLLGDSTTRTIIADLRNAIAESVDGLALSSLAEIGIVTTKTGELELDTERLDAALATDFDDVGRLFSESGGYAERLDVLIEGFMTDDGRLDVRVDGVQARIDDLSEQRVALEERLIVIESRFRAQFTALDVLISELTTTSSFLTQQLANLPGFTRPDST